MSDPGTGAGPSPAPPSFLPGTLPDRPRKRSRRAVLAAVAILMLLGGFGVLLLDQATARYSQPKSCGSCHEMEAAHTSWQQASHFTNRTGVQVTCVACHLPHKDDRIPYLAAKFWVGGKHLAAHVLGRYDADASKQRVLQTLPSERCVGCHATLTNGPSSAAVGIVHQTSLACTAGRAQACVACHDTLHGPRAAQPTRKTYQAGNNAYCLTCHINFAEEELAAVHVRAGIGCIKCHGTSEEHASDEEHLAAPDILFSKARVNGSCMAPECHPRPGMEAEIGHRPFFAGADPSHPYCTACHGQHPLPQRIRRWDKDSRQLLEVNGQPVSPASAGSSQGADGGTR